MSTTTFYNHSSRMLTGRGERIGVARAADRALRRHLDARRVGERVRFAREALDLTQPELGFAIDRSGATISNVETGRRALTTRELVSIARVLGVSVGWLRGGPARSPQLAAIATPASTNGHRRAAA